MQSIGQDIPEALHLFIDVPIKQIEVRLSVATAKEQVCCRNGEPKRLLVVVDRPNVDPTHTHSAATILAERWFCSVVCTSSTSGDRRHKSPNQSAALSLSYGLLPQSPTMAVQLVQSHRLGGEAAGPGFEEFGVVAASGNEVVVGTELDDATFGDHGDPITTLRC